MTYWKLREEYYKHNPNGHFFDGDTLRFFGERVSEMRVYKKTEVVKDYYGNEHECYVLSSYQRKNPAGPRRKWHYFDVETFEIIN